jgi:hypothetical protein
MVVYGVTKLSTEDSFKVQGRSHSKVVNMVLDSIIKLILEN